MNWMNLLMFTVNQITCRKFKELLHVYTGIWQKQIKLRSVWNITNTRPWPLPVCHMPPPVHGAQPEQLGCSDRTTGSPAAPFPRS